MQNTRPILPILTPAEAAARKVLRGSQGLVEAIAGGYAPDIVQRIAAEIAADLATLRAEIA